MKDLEEAWLWFSFAQFESAKNFKEALLWLFQLNKGSPLPLYELMNME